ncbi:MAG: hypothetical protein HOW73_20145 [Polyangiaceae bacterium]|nr:hypothetical protein [Polyangiaceae bacterium]
MSTDVRPSRWQASHILAEEDPEGYTALLKSRDEAIEAGRKAWPGEKEIRLQGFAPAVLADMFSTWSLLEEFQETLQEETGREVTIPEDAKRDLEALLGEWAKTFVTGEVWRFCGGAEFVKL